MKILFLCVGNSGRSQIAEGLAKDMLPKSYDIKSAGSMPAKGVHKDAIAVMNEIGIDISSNETKSIDSIDEKFMKKSYNQPYHTVLLRPLDFEVPGAQNLVGFFFPHRRS